jgi:hypothetical protein
MAIDFPNSPTNDQVFTAGGGRWVYNTASAQWRAQYDWSGDPWLYVVASSAQSINNGSWGQITFDTEIKDDLGIHTSSTFTIPALHEGLWAFTFSGSTVSAGTADIGWAVSTDSYTLKTTFMTDIPLSMTQGGGFIVYMPANTGLRLYAYNNAAGGLLSSCNVQATKILSKR